MGSHIKTNTKSIKTFQFNLKSKVIAAILNCKMKTLTISNIVFLIVAIAFVANATGKRRVTSQPAVHVLLGCPDKCQCAEILVCCKELGVPEECFKFCE